MPAMNEAQPKSGFLALRRARLPGAGAVLPYLREVDANAWYSNFGALNTRLENRLADHFGLKSGQAVCLANGTCGLTLSLMALGAAAGGECLLPSFTFAAVPGAVLAAGLTPRFIDIDPATWALDPARAEKEVAAQGRTGGAVGALIVVSPFGAPVDPAPWEKFTDKTGVPVVIDAAWGFDSARVGKGPVMVSLHATKVLGIGEGGLVACRDKDLISDIRCRANFGFGADRLSEKPGLNAKMSEFAAAVGLAALDAYPAVRGDSLALAGHYLHAFGDAADMDILPGFTGDWASAAFAVRFGRPVAARVAEGLAKEDIEARPWWGTPCHRHPAFAGCPRGDLPETESLAARALNLPFFPDMTEADVHRVRDAVFRVYQGLTL